MARKRKLNDDQAAQIRTLFAEGKTAKEIAAQFGCSPLTAYKINTYKGAYGPSPEELASREAYQPVLNAAGEIVGLINNSDAIIS